MEFEGWVCVGSFVLCEGVEEWLWLEGVIGLSMINVYYVCFCVKLL